MLVGSGVWTGSSLLYISVWLLAVRRSSVGQILIKLFLAPGMNSRQRCQLSNKNSAYSELRRHFSPNYIVCSKNICKVGTIDNKTEAPPPPHSLSLRLAHNAALLAPCKAPRTDVFDYLLKHAASFMPAFSQPSFSERMSL